jgi:hypothetical protein
MRVNSPLMYHAEMILVYKGSNEVIHNTVNRMSYQRINIIRSLKINNHETLEWCIPFKILDVTLMLVMYGQKVYQEIEENGEKKYIHLTNSFFYFNETQDEKKIVIHGLFIYNRQYSEKCILDERFKYQIIFIKDQSIFKMLETSKRLMEEEMEMNM